jgi:protein subunit release factor A
MIPPDELKVTTWPLHVGGQHAGTSSGIQVEHLPTGTIAIYNDGGSQHRNREIAIDMILSALTHPKAYRA